MVDLIASKDVPGCYDRGQQQGHTQRYPTREVRSRHCSAPLSTCSIVKPASTISSHCIAHIRRTFNAKDSTYRVPFSPTRSTVPGMFTDRPVAEISSTVPSSVRFGNTRTQFS